MRVHCVVCHADYRDLEDMPDCCPACQRPLLIEIIEGDQPFIPYILTENDKQFLKARGIKQ